MGIIMQSAAVSVWRQPLHPVGFMVVMTASMLSGLRWTITQVLLQGSPGSQGHGASGGPVEVLLQLTPGMCSHAKASHRLMPMLHLCLQCTHVFAYLVAL